MSDPDRPPVFVRLQFSIALRCSGLRGTILGHAAGILEQRNRLQIGRWRQRVRARNCGVKPHRRARALGSACGDGRSAEPVVAEQRGSRGWPCEAGGSTRRSVITHNWFPTLVPDREVDLGRGQRPVEREQSFGRHASVQGLAYLTGRCCDLSAVGVDLTKWCWVNVGIERILQQVDHLLRLECAELAPRSRAVRLRRRHPSASGEHCRQISPPLPQLSAHRLHPCIHTLLFVLSGQHIQASGVAPARCVASAAEPGAAQATGQQLRRAGRGSVHRSRASTRYTY